MSLITLKVSTVFTVQQYREVIKFHEAKLRPVSEKSGRLHEQKDKKCLRNTNILNYFPRFDNSSIFVGTCQFFTKFSIRWLVL